ncbi:MAG: hypothetical protein Q4F31_08790 [Eubacteriales bacterium]|nr:hypothetical protein [Eubacteriales bacterium]
MAFSDYSDAFSYPEKIVQDLAADLSAKITDACIERLKSLSDSLLPDDEKVLENTWEEICVQVQSEESNFWEVYDDTVSEILCKELSKLPDYSIAALQFAEDFNESDFAYEYDIDELTAILKNAVYEKAGEYQSDSVSRFLESCE